MTKLQKILLTLALLPLLVSLGRAQSTTQIADTVRNADGSLFNGTVVITWTGTSTSTGSSPVPYSTSAKIYNGALSVWVVPTVAYSAYYAAVFNSADGKTSWVENWQVGISSSPLTLSQIRTTLSTTPSSGTTLSMSQITGLSAYLNALSSSLNTVSSTIGGFSSSIAGLNNSVSSLTDRVNTLQVAVSNPVSTTVVEGETPTGAVNGSNSIFTIATTPTVTSSLMLFRNGILQIAGVDYSLSGKTITFAALSLPQTGDALQASYRIGTVAQSAGFVDNETPQGTINGSNLIFTLAASPLNGTLRLYKNGALLQQNTDYTLSTTTVSFVSTAATPASGDKLVAYYRVTTP